jgi:hypothetical protein
MMRKDYVSEDDGDDSGDGDDDDDEDNDHDNSIFYVTCIHIVVRLPSIFSP